LIAPLRYHLPMSQYGRFRCVNCNLIIKGIKNWRQRQFEYVSSGGLGNINDD